MTIKEKIFKKLDKDGYINDSELFKIYGKEPNFQTGEEYKRQWDKLQRDREFFADKKLFKLEHFRRRYTFMISKNEGYRIGKDYYEELQKNGK